MLLFYESWLPKWEKTFKEKMHDFWEKANLWDLPIEDDDVEEISLLLGKLAHAIWIDLSNPQF